MGLLAIGLSVNASPMPHQARWGLLLTLITVLIPVLYVVWLVQRGKVTGFHLVARHERLGPFIVTLIAALVGCAFMQQPSVSPTLKIVALLNMIQTLLLMTITLQWKISIHSTAVSGAAVLAYYFASSVMLPLLLCVPLIGWSRIYLKRHTPAQVLAGAMLGPALVYTVMQAAGV